MAGWVGTEIVTAGEKSRGKVAKHFAKVVKELVKFNNYNSSMAMMAALQESTSASFACKGGFFSRRLRPLTISIPFQSRGSVYSTISAAPISSPMIR